MELTPEITRLSQAHHYTLVAARQIPRAKRGNKFYFIRSELQRWIMTGKCCSRVK
jgi:predicted DNA-binding transcriptional regulator AlpA